MNYLGFSDGFEAVPDLAPPHAPRHGIIRINYQVMRQRAFNAAYLSESEKNRLIQIKERLKEIKKTLEENPDEKPLVVEQKKLEDAANKIRVSTDCMVVIDVLLNMELLGEETNATDLKKRVAKTLDRRTLGPALDAIKEALAKDMIAFTMRGAKKIFGSAPSHKAKSEKVSRIMQHFPDVLLAQMANPDDHTAGRDLLPVEDREVYFNILATYESYKKKGKKT